jgi:hypothetical protein
LLPNGKVLVAGGLRGVSGCLSSAELYDPASGSWSATGSLHTARNQHAATLLPNGNVLVAGGGGDNSGLSSAELYDSVSGTWTVTGSLNDERIYDTATLLPNGQVLVAGGVDQIGPVASAELYSSSTSTCPTITVSPDHLDPATVGKNYDKDINAGGGHGPYTFAVTGGSLSPGLHLDPDTHLRGTPITPGSYTFTITATDSNGCMGSRTYTMTVNCPTIHVGPGSPLPNGKVGQKYSKTITAGGGASPYTFVVTNGGLPPGMTLSHGGVISGPPIAAGIYSFTIQATDAYGCTGTKTYSLTVAN